MNFPSQIFFNDINHGYRTATTKKNSFWLLPFYMAVATYFYYEKVHRTMRTAILSYLLKTVFRSIFTAMYCIIIGKIAYISSFNKQVEK